MISTPKSGADGPKGGPTALQYWRDYHLWCKLRHPSTYGRGCAFDAKKGLRRRRTRLVSRFWQGSKKNFKKMDFWFQVYAQMIESRLDFTAEDAENAESLQWSSPFD